MKKFRLAIYLLLLSLIVILAWLYVVPGGKASYSLDFKEKPFNLFFGRGFFHKLTPTERWSDGGLVVGDPAYFHLRTSRRFSSAKVSVKYRFSPALDPARDYLNVAGGVLLDQANWRYSLIPIFNSKLNGLADQWDLKPSGSLLLFQSDPKFSSPEDFVKSGDFSSALFYNYDPDRDYLLDSYQADDRTIELSDLRGSYSFYTYLKEEDLKVDFSLLNDQVDEVQAVDLLVYYRSQLIFSQNVSVASQALALNLSLSDLPEGVYRVEIKADDDLRTLKLKSFNSKLVFINRLWLDLPEAKLEVWSDKSNFKIKSWSAQNLGLVSINGQDFTLDKIYRQFDLKGEDQGLNKLTAEFGGLLIENNGLLAPTAESFFDPRPQSLSSDSDWKGIDTVVANYRPAVFDGQYYRSEFDLDLSSAVYTSDGYRFIISAPFLSEPDSARYLEIEEIKIELQGATLMEKIKKMIKRYESD